MTTQGQTPTNSRPAPRPSQRLALESEWVSYYPPPQAYLHKDKVIAGLLTFFLGTIGIQGFYLGNTAMGLGILLLNLFVVLPLSVIFFGIPALLMGTFLLIQTIVFFATSDEDFHRKFVVEQRWL